MKNIYAEVGLGNASFLSTEIENNKVEHRIPRFIKPDKIKDYYLRICLFKLTVIFSTKDFIKIKTSKKNKFRFVFGIGGFKK